ncbi:MAG: SMP-30/gluconolactonase/LRE family protein [Clostridia bacterium]|jgi:DNA-binding beta-propeller fold protein YncE|nr:SMP-30/gluconolactonase/LRE family protein [Clostridia bacterium]
MNIIIKLAMAGVSRSLVYKLMIGIIFIGQATFFTSYLMGRDVASLGQELFTLAPGTPGIDQGISQPQFSLVIHGAFGEGQLVKPMAVTTANNRIYVSDTGNHRIQVFDMNGNFLFHFGQVGRQEGQFHFPYGIAGDSEGRIYVADLYQSKISVFNPEGEFLHYFGDAEAQKAIDGPGDIFITEDNKLYLTDINQSKILIFDIAEGNLLLEFGEFGRSAGQFYAPNGVAVDRQGNIWVVDTGNQRVQVFDQEGKFLRIINGTPDGTGDSVLANPRGVGIRGNNAVIVSNLTHTIFGFDQQGVEVFRFGGLGSMNTQFNFPNGLHVDENGHVYITDTINQRVVVYR